MNSNLDSEGVELHCISWWKRQGYLLSIMAERKAIALCKFAYVQMKYIFRMSKFAI
jgi:hypothetical protein